MRRLLLLPLTCFTACLTPLPLGAPCALGQDDCEADLVCTPHEDRAICAPDRGAGPPAACVPREEALVDEPGRLATALSAADETRGQFGVLWSSSSNVNTDGDISFTLVDARSDAPLTTTPLFSSAAVRPFAQGLAYSPIADRYAAVWFQDVGGDLDELFVRIIDGDGSPTGPVRATGFTSAFFDNMDLVVVDGGFELYVSVRDQDPGPGFGAAGLFQLSIDDDGVTSDALLLDNAVYDGRTIVDPDGVTWFTFSEGNTVENHVSVGRIVEGVRELRFAEPATGSGVIGSQILPFTAGPMLLWREQGEPVDQLCLLSDCANTRADAPFSPGGYGNGELEILLLDDGRAQIAGTERATGAPAVLIFDPQELAFEGLTLLGDNEGFPRVSMARERDALLATFTQQIAQGSSAHSLELTVLCDDGGAS